MTETLLTCCLVAVVLMNTVTFLGCLLVIIDLCCPDTIPPEGLP